MAIENELRFLVSKEFWNILTQNNEHPGYMIEQLYITPENRARSKRLLSRPDQVEYEYTFKKRLPDQTGALEFNQQISEKDFEHVRSLSERRVVKQRYSFDAPDHRWDVDWFFDDYDVVIAEIELPESVNKLNISTAPHWIRSAYTYTKYMITIPRGVLSSYDLAGPDRQDCKRTIQGLIDDATHF